MTTITADSTPIERLRFANKVMQGTQIGYLKMSREQVAALVAQIDSSHPTRPSTASATETERSE